MMDFALRDHDLDIANGDFELCATDKEAHLVQEGNNLHAGFTTRALKHIDIKYSGHELGKIRAAYFVILAFKTYCFSIRYQLMTNMRIRAKKSMVSYLMLCLY